jgi:hypothetical protein
LNDTKNREKNTMRDDDICMRTAFAAYFRRFGDMADQPSRSYSDIETHKGRDYVILRNVRGVLAAWRINEKGGLHFVTGGGPRE